MSGRFGKSQTVWEESDRAEWTKVAATGALRPLSPQDSKRVLAELEAQGKLNRVLPTRMVRRRKPGELPGDASTPKSRLCIRGDCDPDFLDISKHAPTASSLTLAMAMQVCATRKFRASVGDLRNAFMQSDELHRSAGKLYIYQPSRGLHGLQPGQILEVVAGAYGLNDAPAHWRMSLKKSLLGLRYVQSSLDPTLFLLKGKNEVEGLVIVEVDDLFTAGAEDHYRRMNQLQQKYTFGKFQFHPGGAGGCRIQRASHQTVRRW